VRWGHSPLIAMKGTKAVVVGTSRSQRADIRSSHPSAMMPRMDGAPMVLVILAVWSCGWTSRRPVRYTLIFVFF
jgi:hypothetical protein